jgi:hypothetical protein
MGWRLRDLLIDQLKRVAGRFLLGFCGNIPLV